MTRQREQLVSDLDFVFVVITLARYKGWMGWLCTCRDAEKPANCAITCSSPICASLQGEKCVHKNGSRRDFIFFFLFNYNTGSTTTSGSSSVATLTGHQPLVIVTPRAGGARHRAPNSSVRTKVMSCGGNAAALPPPLSSMAAQEERAQRRRARQAPTIGGPSDAKVEHKRNKRYSKSNPLLLLPQVVGVDGDAAVVDRVVGIGAEDDGSS